MFDVFLKKQSAGEHDGSALRDSVVRGPQEGPWWGLGRPSKRDYPDPPCEDPVSPPPSVVKAARMLVGGSRYWLKTKQ